MLLVDSEEALHQYFDLFGPEFMERLPSSVKLSKHDKYTYYEEISSFEAYLIKKNKKFLNVLYLSFKYPQFCELYFKESAENPADDQSD